MTPLPAPPCPECGAAANPRDGWLCGSYSRILPGGWREFTQTEKCRADYWKRRCDEMAERLRELGVKE